MAGYKVYSVSTTTWGDRQLVDAKAAPWKRTNNESAGGLQTSFKLSDPNVSAIYKAGALTPVDRCLVVEHDGVVLYAGVIWEDDYDNDTRTLTVSHEDIWSLLELRLIAADRTGEGIPAWKQTYSDLAYDTIIKRIIQLATTGAGRTIPIQYEADYPGIRSRTYYGYNLDLAVDAITEIMNIQTGPDVDLRPEWGPGNTLQWTLRTGNMNPDSQTIEVVVGADQSAVKGLKCKRSGRELATRVMGVGEGTGKDIKVRSATRSGALQVERVEQAKNIKSLGELQSFAEGEISARTGLITQYSMDLNINSPVIKNLWSLKPGAFLRWYTKGNPAIPDGWKTSTIIEYSGDTTSNWIHLELQ